MNKDIKIYHDDLLPEDKAICEILYKLINENLPNAESKVWHAHPVWFLDGNPIVGYSKQKAGLRLMFWSGNSFENKGLMPGTGKFKDASIFYQTVSDIDADDLKKWLEEASEIQWDYKNIVKNKGLLNRLK